MPQENDQLILRPRRSAMLPNNATYQNRFQIHSESSDSIYVIAQSKTGLWWSCGCHGWIRHRHCKHLDALGLPGHKVPFEAKLESAPQ